MNTQDNQGNGLIGGGIGAILGGGLVAALPNAPVNYYMNRTQAGLDDKRDDIYRSYSKAVEDMSDLAAKYGDDLFPDITENGRVRRGPKNPEAATAYNYASKVRQGTQGMLFENTSKMNELEKFPTSRSGQAMALLYRLGAPITAALLGSSLTD